MVGRVAALLVGSGACALAYQTVWLRELRLVFGASTPATAATLAIFLGGLGAGALWIGPLADRHPRPLRLYAQLELTIAIGALLSPVLLALVRSLYIASGGTSALGGGLATVVRLVLSALVLAVPTLAIGGTLPAAARAVESEGDLGRGSTARLYGWNTVGAVLGVLFPTLILLEALGTRGTLIVAVLLNLIIAGSAYRLSARVDTAAPRDGDEAEEQESESAPTTPTLPTALLAGVAAGAGFVFLLLELVWIRMLAPLLGGSTYTFGVLLSAILVGIGGGGLIAARVFRERTPPPILLALTCGLEALAVGVPLALGDRIPRLASALRSLDAFGFSGEVVGWWIIAAGVVLPASLVAGFQFPLIIALLGRGRTAIGRHVGVVAAANTGGALAGALAGGFGILVWLSAPGAWRAATILLVLLGGVALVASIRRAPSKRLRPIEVALTLLVALLVIVFAPDPGPVWRQSPIGAGRARIPSDPVERREAAHRLHRSIVWEQDGFESNVAISNSDGVAFIVNGKSDGNAKYDAATQVMSGLLGPLLRPEVRTALVIGLGTGSTAGWLAAVPGIESVEVVELEPAVLEAARRSAAVNRAVLDDRKVTVRIGDARERLLTAREDFDLIFSEPSNPYRAGVASLFTREFYQAVRERLSEDGIFIQWIQAYEIDAQSVRGALATLASVFPVVETWQTQPTDLMLIATHDERPIDIDQLRIRITEPPFAEALSHVWRTSSVEGLLARFVAGPTIARDLLSLEKDRLNTDDHTRIEFALARSVGRALDFRIDDLRRLATLRGEAFPLVVGEELDGDRIVEARLAMSILEGVPPLDEEILSDAVALRAAAIVAYVEGDLAGVRERWGAQPSPPRTTTELLIVGESLAEFGDAKALVVADALERAFPVEAEIIRARLQTRILRIDDAVAALERAYVLLRSDPWPWDLPVLRSFDLAAEIAPVDSGFAERLGAALAEPFAVSLLDEERTLARFRVTVSAGGAAAVAALEPYVIHPIWDRVFLVARERVYREASDPRAASAARDLELFDREAGPTLEQELLPR